MSLWCVHVLLGQSIEGNASNILKHIVWSIKFVIYESCANTEAKQKNMTKSSGTEKAIINCIRIHSDILTIKPRDGENTIPRNN